MDFGREVIETSLPFVANRDSEWGFIKEEPEKKVVGLNDHSIW
jgi:hypothetical protein